MNVFSDEIAHYDGLADTWHEKEGSIQNLKQFGRFKARWLRPFLRPNIQLLDVGCGGGYLAKELIDLEPTLRIDAIDTSPETIAHNASRYPRIKFWTSDIDGLPQQPKYDWIVLSELLEHVPRPLALIDSASARLKPQGYLFVATPARTRLSQFAIILMAERFFKFIPRGTHQYKRFVARKVVKTHLHNHGFEIVKEAGTLMNPFTKVFHLWPFKSVHYMLLARKK